MGKRCEEMGEGIEANAEKPCSEIPGAFSRGRVIADADVTYYLSHGGHLVLLLNKHNHPCGVDILNWKDTSNPKGPIIYLPNNPD